MSANRQPPILLAVVALAVAVTVARLLGKLTPGEAIAIYGALAAAYSAQRFTWKAR